MPRFIRKPQQKEALENSQTEMMSDNEGEKSSDETSQSPPLKKVKKKASEREEVEVEEEEEEEGGSKTKTARSSLEKSSTGLLVDQTDDDDEMEVSGKSVLENKKKKNPYNPIPPSSYINLSNELSSFKEQSWRTSNQHFITCKVINADETKTKSSYRIKVIEFSSHYIKADGTPGVSAVRYLFSELPAIAKCIEEMQALNSQFV